MEVVGRGDAGGYDGLPGMASSGASPKASHQGRGASGVQHRVEQAGATRAADAFERGASVDSTRDAGEQGFQLGGRPLRLVSEVPAGRVGGAISTSPTASRAQDAADDERGGGDASRLEEELEESSRARDCHTGRDPLAWSVGQDVGAGGENLQPSGIPDVIHEGDPGS